MTLVILREALEALGASEAASLCVRADEFIAQQAADLKAAKEDHAKQLAVEKERLTQAMKREESLKEKARELEVDLRKSQANELSLRNEIERMESHPEVRAVKAARLAEQIASLTEQRSKLVPPSAGNPTDIGNPTEGEEDKKEPETPAPNVQVEHLHLPEPGEEQTGD